MFVFLFSVYYLLTNEKMTFSEVLPGTIVATIALEASFQLLPVYLRLSRDVIALQAFGAPALLLVWLYLMANVIVFGAEVNWWLARGRRLPSSSRKQRGSPKPSCRQRTVVEAGLWPLARGGSSRASSRCPARPRCALLPRG